MTDEEYWRHTEDVEDMLRVLRGRGSDRKLRLFTCLCCRDVETALSEQEREAIALAERYADSLADDIERAAVLSSLVEAAGGSTDLSRHGTPHGYVVPAFSVRPLLAVFALMTNDEYIIHRDDGEPIFRVADQEHQSYERAEEVADWTVAMLAYERQEASRGFFGRVHELMFRCFNRMVDGEWPTDLSYDGGFEEEPCRIQRDRLHDIFGNPFRPVAFDPAWLTSDVQLLARGIYDERAFDRMPILADALQESGCTNEDILNHCRDTSLTHVRGCWVVDLVLGKE